MEDGESNQANHAKLGSVAAGRKNLEESSQDFPNHKAPRMSGGNGGPGPGPASPDDEDRESRHTTIPSLYVS
jgi:hypothetical protein